MSRDQFSGWVRTHLVSIIIAVASAGIAFGLLKADVTSRASAADLQTVRAELNRKADRVSVMETLRRVDDRTARIERYLCRKSPNDLGC